MNQTYISLDLETTGLDPERDQIIEIGAVKFQGKEVLDTFSTLVNPGCSLPYHVSLITGITSEELEAAPPFPVVAASLLSFVGDYPIVGQNVNFDLDFLRSQGISFSGTVYDTLEIANILLPQIADRSLPTLAAHLGVSYPVHHRALADAVTTKDVFLALLEKASRFELPLITQINRITASTDWVLGPFFHEIEKEKMKGVSLWDMEKDFAPSAMEPGQEEPPSSSKHPAPLDLKQLTSLLGDDGLLAGAFPAFESRPGQVQMMQVIAEAMNDRQHLIIEAGTGIGKSIAYLLPAIYFALGNGIPVVISTNTINLQEQLTKKDIPDLIHALGMPHSNDLQLKVAQLKGRNNYLCLRRWDSWYIIPRLPWEEIRFLLRLLIWLSSTATGDRSELNLPGGDSYLWNRICASEDNCVIERCPYYPKRCFLYRARQSAEGAHLIVTNHALLLSDLTKNNGVLPEYSHLVIDEAHHLEDEATEQLGYQVTQQDISDYLNRFGDRGGFGFHLQNYLRTTFVDSSKRKEIEQRIRDLKEQARRVEDYFSQLFELITDLVSQRSRGQSSYETHLRLTRGIHTYSLWSDIEFSWENCNSGLGAIELGLSQLENTLDGLPDRWGIELSSALSEISSMHQQSQGLCGKVESIIAGSEGYNIYWASLKGHNNALSLHAAPLRVGPELERLLFSQKDCVILTSATLTTEGNFDFTKDALGLIEAKELIIDAPFDYMASTMIYLPQDVPEPDKPGYQQMVEEFLVDLCRVTKGRTMVLFTSHAALRATYNAVRSPLEEEGILVLGQGLDGGPKRLLDTFKTNKSILLGTTSFWEGIDVVGKALSVLVITRLPFSVPTDPVFSARSELFDNPFNQYTVPQTAIRFKQGFGRLIRSSDDRGVMIVLDSRLQTKPYGRVLLDSLPRCKIRRGKLRQMPEDVVEWLGD